MGGYEARGSVSPLANPPPTPLFFTGGEGHRSFRGGRRRRRRRRCPACRRCAALVAAHLHPLAELLAHLLAGGLAFVGGDLAVVVQIHPVEAFERLLAEFLAGDHAIGIAAHAVHAAHPHVVAAAMAAAPFALAGLTGGRGAIGIATRRALVGVTRLPALVHFLAHLFARRLALVRGDLAVVIGVDRVEHPVGARERFLTGDRAIAHPLVRCARRRRCRLGQSERRRPGQRGRSERQSKQQLFLHHRSSCAAGRFPRRWHEN